MPVINIIVGICLLVRPYNERVYCYDNDESTYLECHYKLKDYVVVRKRVIKWFLYVLIIGIGCFIALHFDFNLAQIIVHINNDFLDKAIIIYIACILGLIPAII